MNVIVITIIIDVKQGHCHKRHRRRKDHCHNVIVDVKVTAIMTIRDVPIITCCRGRCLAAIFSRRECGWRWCRQSRSCSSGAARRTTPVNTVQYKWQHSTMQCKWQHSTVQCKWQHSTMQYKWQYSTVQCNTACNTVQCYTAYDIAQRYTAYNIAQCNTAYNTVQCNTVQDKTVQYAVQCNTVCNTVRCNTL